MIKKYFSPLILCVSTLLLIYTYYKSEIYWDGKLNNYYTKYYLISAISIIFSIISFFLNNKIKEYLSIVIFTTIFSLYCFEFYKLFQDENKKNLSKKIEIFKKQTGNEYDIRSVKEVYNDLKKSGDKVAVKVSPIEYLKKKDIDIYPLSGVSHSKTVYQNENGYYMIYLSDRYGFNNPDKEWDSEEIEYLLVGDSFAHGAAVNRPNDIGSVLRIISSKNTLNIGYSGNGPIIEYATLKEFFPNNKVNKVLWLFTENDVPGFDYEYENKFLQKYLVDKNFTQNLKEKQSQVDKIVIRKINKEGLKNFKVNIFKFLKLYKTRELLIGNNKTNKKRSVQPELAKLIKMARDYSIKKGSEFYLVYMPVERYFDEKYENTIYMDLINIAEEHKIPLIDLHLEVFNKENDPLKLFPFRFFGHYNIEGYKKAAEAIYIFTSKN